MNVFRDLVQWLAIAGALAILVVLLAALCVRVYERWLDWRCDRANARLKRIWADPKWQYWNGLLCRFPTAEETAELRTWRVERGFEA